VELEPSLDFEVAAYRKAAPQGALVLRLGSNGRPANEVALFREMGQRVLYFTGHHPAGLAPAPDALADVEMGYAFGDACVAVPGYPIRILPPSGVVQLAVFGAEDAQVRAE
jgi:hypothetical protein